MLLAERPDARAPPAAPRAPARSPRAGTAPPRGRRSRAGAPPSTRSGRRGRSCSSPSPRRAGRSRAARGPPGSRGRGGVEDRLAGAFSLGLQHGRSIIDQPVDRLQTGALDRKARSFYSRMPCRSTTSPFRSATTRPPSASTRRPSGRSASRSCSTGPTTGAPTSASRTAELACGWSSRSSAGRLEVALPAEDAGSVYAFHNTAIAAGARTEWAPGVRPEYDRGYFAARVLDFDGNSLEAVFRGLANAEARAA